MATERRTGGKTTCKYYDACGTRENCSRCNGYSKYPKYTNKRKSSQ